MTDFFSPDYATARTRFRSGVLANGGQIESILLDAKGPGESDLTIDVGWFGSPAPRRAFIHSSGLHGVEGFAGSAIQLQWLEAGMPQLPRDSAIAIVHAMNPFGMAWLRRANENNVDLNHNFLPADEEYAGAPECYASLNSFLNPESPPARDFFPLRAACRMLRHGLPAFRRAITEGQYDFPLGLFFGGKRHEQSVRRFQLYISERLAGADRLVVVDLHTGEGSFGEDSLLVDGAGERTASAAEMQQAYGDRVRTIGPVPTRGALDGLYLRMFPAATVCFATQKFGACSPLRALSALRSENRAHYYDGVLDHPARAQLLETFCPSGLKWREKVLTRGKEVIAQGLALAFDDPSVSAAADGVTAD